MADNTFVRLTKKAYEEEWLLTPILTLLNLLVLIPALYVGDGYHVFWSVTWILVYPVITGMHLEWEEYREVIGDLPVKGDDEWVKGFNND